MGNRPKVLIPSRKKQTQPQQLPAALRQMRQSTAPPQKRQPKLPLEILICTPDITSELAQRCIRSLKETTGHIECTIKVVDNNRTLPFNHPAAINRALDTAKGYLVICDDDVTFTQGWLDSALDIVENRDDCGIVAFHLFDEPGQIWASAMWNEPDGNFRRHQVVYNQACCIPSQCSACWLIAPTQLRMDERYKKCRFEHVFCYETWESGKRVYLSPSVIYHDKGGQFNKLCDAHARSEQYKHDFDLYRQEWYATDREHQAYILMGPYLPNTLMGEATDEQEGSCPFAKHPARMQKVQPVKAERRAMCTIAVGGGVYEMGLPLMRRYARKIGADFFVFDDKWISTEYSPMLLKWKVNTLFSMGYNRVLYVDADVLIKPESPDIFDEVPVGTLGVFDESEIMRLYPVDRARTCKKFVDNWRTKWGKIDYEYPGYYFNAGVVVCDPTCNPFIYREDGIYGFNNDPLIDQTYLNVVSAKMPKTLLNWKWNRMGVKIAHKFFNTDDMLDGSYFAHYCGMSGKEKPIMAQDLRRILPEAIERKPGPRLDGIYEFWEYVKRNGDIHKGVEIGSAHGESAWVATEVIPDIQLTCIDPWDTKRYGDVARADFVMRHGWNKNVVAVRDYSTTAARAVSDRTLDVTYIDAVHEYKNVLEDIQAWLPKIKIGGFIGGHDYTPRNRPELPAFPGTCHAVNEIFGGPDIVFQDSSWVVRV